MEDRMFCYCLLKRKSEVMAAWAKSPTADAETFMRETKIGTVCTSCRLDVKQLLADLNAGRVTVPAASAPLPEVYSNRKPKLSIWKRFKRAVRQSLKRREGMRSVAFHTMFRTDDGFTSAIQVSNFVNPDFPRSTVDLDGTLSLFDHDGSLLATQPFSVKRDAGCALDIGRISSIKSFGSAHIVLRPARERDRNHWRVGTNRPYVSWERDGHVATVHEKSVDFETERVLPGVRSNPALDVQLFVANLGERPGHVKLRLESASHEAVHDILLGPHASSSFFIPDEISGEPVTTVHATSDIGIAGYQMFRNRTSGFFSLQHLVKEGS